MISDRYLEGLTWLHDEIVETLNASVDELASYQTSRQADCLDHCQEQFQRVLGSLKVAGCGAGVQLLTEMVRTLDTLRAKPAVADEGCAVLAQAIDALPRYLARLQQGEEDHPALLMSVLNDLRAVRSEPLYSETEAFAPDLTLLNQVPTPPTPESPEEWRERVQKLCHFYQVQLIPLLKGEPQQDQLRQLAKVIEPLEALFARSNRQCLWRAAGGFFEALLCGRVLLGAGPRSLLRGLERELRLAAEQDHNLRAETIPVGLLRNLLFYVALAGRQSPRRELLWQKFGLEQSLPASMISDREVVLDDSVVVALAANLAVEVASIKTTLEDYLADDCSDADPLRNAVQTTRCMADALLIAGQIELKTLCDTMATLLENVVATESSYPERNSLDHLAVVIVDLEADLQSWSAGARQRSIEEGVVGQSLAASSAHHQLLEEIIRELGDLKEALLNHLDSDEPVLPATYGEALTHLSIVLKVVDMSRCAALMADLRKVSNQALKGIRLDTLADVLTGVERYLENCLVGRERHDASLSWAEQALAALLAAPEDAGSAVVLPGDFDMDFTYAVFEPDSRAESGEPAQDQSVALMYDTTEVEAAQSEAAASAVMNDPVLPIYSELGQALDQEAGEQLDRSLERKSAPGLGGDPPVNDAIEPTESVGSAFGDSSESSREGDSCDQDDGIDDDLRDIFITEAREVLQTLADSYPRWQTDVSDRSALADTRRGFHTLKGSGRMVNALVIGELAWSMENLLNRVIDRRIEPFPALYDCLGEAIARLPDLIAAFERGEVIDDTAVTALQARAEVLARGEWPLGDAGNISQELQQAGSGMSEFSEEDRELHQIFLTEARIHLDVVQRFIADQHDRRPLYTPPTASLQSALHTLKGSTHMAGIESLAQLVSAMERLSRDLLTTQISMDDESVQLLDDGAILIGEVLQAFGSSELPLIADHRLNDLLARCESYRSHVLSNDPSGSIFPADRLLKALMHDGLAEIMAMDQWLPEWHAGSTQFDPASFVRLAEELENAAAHAAASGCAAIEDLVTALHEMCNRLAGGSGEVADEWVDVVLQARESLLSMCDALAAHQEMPWASEALLTALAAIGVVHRDPHQIAESLRERLAVLNLPDEADNEIVELFLGEAEELLESMEQSFHEWREEPADKLYPETLKRALHTFKGGARMAALDELADISHELESEVQSCEAVVAAGDVSPIAIMLVFHDALVLGIDRVRTEAHRIATAAAAEHQPEAPGSWPTAEIIPFAGVQRGLEDAPAATEQSSNANLEAIRLPAPVLDTLVNLAGEASISRGQVEQHVNEFMSSLDEMEMTIRRMHDQVRRLGIETDAQVSFRREQIEASEGSDGFDPLEMDRYSQLQQLSRSLLESGSDLKDLRDTLLDKARDAETLLLHQSRLNTDLQESLMRTRMVPFSRMVPRLRRIVRQVAGALGKQVSLQLESVEGELDRTVLERIVPALEHMVRNAIDHGIESADERAAMGKTAEGILSVSLFREGGDVLISLVDDGRGLDVEAICARALANGLVRENTILSDHEIQQFIFAPGFSTSREVTDVSGRGIGMDVVNSEVRQLGGSIGISSQPGAGTEFTLRLPFTLSVNRALMIEVGEDSYAVPLNTITGVTRVAVDDLLHLYQNPDKTLSYGGENYQVYYLGSLLSPDIQPMLDTALGRQLPVILIRSEGRHYAVQVDGLEGSREIVVKTLGAQFSRVPGLSGATVLGDGRVVVILDLQALLREQITAPMPIPMIVESAHDKSAERLPIAMVVDDSVTVRKVTSRFLEREGFSVLTVKDGIDAMRMLQDHTPDLMLLDIEMPRMDGFEVIRLVRSTQRLAHLPIVMITSRTGEKHRERALSMGADQYLGKPYQEEELIDVVRRLLAHGRINVSGGQAG